MKIKFLGHSSFLITSDSGVRILTDPYAVGGPLTYDPIDDAADVVLVSHGHGDHNNVSAVKGNPVVIKSPGDTEAKGIAFKGIATFHDQAQGKEKGANIVFCFTVDGVKVCHVGDLGHQLDARQAAEVGSPDVLLLIVGGNYAIGPEEATKLARQLNPRVIIPMHYKNARCGYPIAPVDDFLKGKKNVVKATGSEVALDARKLPQGEIIVLQPSKS
ncbi:MAG: MBL fold metallo-hydrolase [Dehalococcoidia bacterium]|nr:MBL fold metallo-hydrolase [Dehalococcoidia bacterium]